MARRKIRLTHNVNLCLLAVCILALLSSCLHAPAPPPTESTGQDNVISNQISVSASGVFYFNGYTKNITCFDFGLSDEIVLCDKPNCMHTDKLCGAFFMDYNSIKGIAEYAGWLYSFQYDEDIKVWSLVQSEINGSNQKKITQLPSGNPGDIVFVQQPCIYYDHTVYFTISYLSSENSESTQIASVNLETKKLSLLTDVQSENESGFIDGYSLVNVYDGIVILSETYFSDGVASEREFYEENDISSDYIQYTMPYMRTKFSALDPATGEIFVLAGETEAPSSIAVFHHVVNEKFIYAAGTMLNSVDVRTKKCTMLFSFGEMVYITEILDDKVFLTIGAEDDSVKYFDLLTGTLKELPFSNSSPERLYPCFEINDFLICLSARDGYVWTSKEDFYAGKNERAAIIGWV